jgi:hypothetical protein
MRITSLREERNSSEIRPPPFWCFFETFDFGVEFVDFVGKFDAATPGGDREAGSRAARASDRA